MYKFGFIATFILGLSAFVVPQESEAAKIKIEPSITFKNSYRHIHRPRVFTPAPPAPVPVVAYPYYNPYYAYSPYPQVVVQQPPVVVQQPPVYLYDGYYPYPAPLHSYGTDFQLKFKIK